LTGCDQSDETKVASLSANLAELIHAMLQDGRALIALCKFSDDRYVQFWLQSDGRLIGEVISNLNVDPSKALEPRAEQRLRELGFHEPAPGPQPNWWFASTNAADNVRLLHMMNAVIYDVLEEAPNSPVSITTWLAVTQPGEYSDALGVPSDHCRSHIMREGVDNIP
jgi:hypothetical protein